MDGTNPDPLFGLVIGSGPMSITHTTTNTLTGGPSTAMQTILTQLPPPVTISQTVTNVITGGSGPSTNIVPLTIPKGSGPSITMPQVPPVVQVHHVPVNPTTIVGPSHINLGSNLPFMARLNLPDLARLTNDPSVIKPFGLPCQPNTPQTSLSLRGRQASDLKTT